VVGDVLDESAVQKALDGCEAVVHAAAVFSFDPRRAEEMLRTNERATELVLGGAVARGLGPVVHVSSTVALVRHGGTGRDLPLGDLDLPYARSKIASERIARGLQDEGAPVVTVYPGGVLGPHDPYYGTTTEMLVWLAKGRLAVYPRGGLHYVDVRDVADVVVTVVGRGHGGRRYVVPGTHVDGELLFGTTQRLTGRRLPHVEPPRGVVAATAWVADRFNRLAPPRWHFPADVEAMEMLARDTRFDTSPAGEELGVVARPFDDTVRDTLLSLAAAGHLRPRHLGKLRAG
jgi:nucleoside-diphosphate-sugar epimerase